MWADALWSEKLAAPYDAAWQARLAKLEAHIATHGALPPKIHTSGIGYWVAHQLEAKRAADTDRRCSTRPQRAGHDKKGGFLGIYKARNQRRWAKVRWSWGRK
jgi:hypothetical protein